MASETELGERKETVCSCRKLLKKQNPPSLSQNGISLNQDQVTLSKQMCKQKHKDRPEENSYSRHFCRENLRDRKYITILKLLAAAATLQRC
jgi:hypothetical protein